MSKENPAGDQRDPGRGPTSSTPQPLVPPEPAREPAVPSQGVPDAASEPARVLLLEDEAWDAEHARRLLTKAGMNFILVVVDALDEFAGQLTEFAPDVIVSDYSLPGFKGTDALRIVQERSPHVPFIFWSGILGDETAADMIKQGATDYILKDRPARLPSAVERALVGARQRLRLAQVEEQLTNAQRLASLGRLVAAEQEVKRTRQLLATIRSEIEANPAE